MKLHLVCTVWGDAFIENLFNRCIPSLLSSKNIPAIWGQHEVIFSVATHSYEFDRIRSDNRLGPLGKILQLHPITTSPTRTSHWGIWHSVFSEFHEYNKVIIIPDCVYVNGVLSEIVDAFAGGAEVIYYPVPQVALEVISDYPFDFEKFDKAEAIRLWHAYINPKHAAMSVSGSLRVAHQEFLIDIQAGQLGLSELVGHPLAIRHDYAYRSYTLNPLDRHARQAYLSIQGFGCEPVMKFAEVYTGFIGKSKSLIEGPRSGSWAAHFQDGYFDRYARVVHNLSNTENAAKFRRLYAHVIRTIVFKTWFKIVNMLSASGNLFDVSVIELAAIDPFIYRHVKRLDRMTIFIPTKTSVYENALECCWDDLKLFREFVLMHVVERHFDVGPGRCFGVCGGSSHSRYIEQHRSEALIPFDSSQHVYGITVGPPILISESIRCVPFEAIQYGETYCRTDILPKSEKAE